MIRFTDTDEKFMRLAIDEARLALAENEVAVGCVIAEGGSVLSRAHNGTERAGDPTAHAEMLAIRRADRYALRRATLYVTLEPCPMCAGAIMLSGIKRVVWGAADRACGCCGSVYRITEDPAFPSFCPADGGLMGDECAELLKTGFEKARKKTDER